MARWAMVVVLVYPFLGEGQSVRALAKELAQAKEEGRRAKAALALAQAKDPQACSSLIQAAADPSALVRAEVAAALGAIPLCQGGPALKRLQGDSDHAVKRAAQQALASLGFLESYEPPAPDPLASRIKRKVLVNLGTIENQTPFPALTPLLQEALTREVSTVPLFTLVDEAPTGLRTKHSARAITLMGTISRVVRNPLEGTSVIEFTVEVKVVVLREPGAEVALVASGETTVHEPAGPNGQDTPLMLRSAVDRALHEAFRDVLHFGAKI